MNILFHDISVCKARKISQEKWGKNYLKYLTLSQREKEEKLWSAYFKTNKIPIKLSCMTNFYDKCSSIIPKFSRAFSGGYVESSKRVFRRIIVLALLSQRKFEPSWAENIWRKCFLPFKINFPVWKRFYEKILFLGSDFSLAEYDTLSVLS